VITSRELEKKISASSSYEGALKIRDWKMRDWNYRHQTAGVENAGLELSAPSYKGRKMRDWKIREREKYGTPCQ